jgi:hypothetical protein
MTTWEVVLIAAETYFVLRVGQWGLLWGLQEILRRRRIKALAAWQASADRARFPGRDE